jgi:hypothetical protein
MGRPSLFLIVITLLHRWAVRNFLDLRTFNKCGNWRFYNLQTQSFLMDLNLPQICKKHIFSSYKYRLKMPYSNLHVNKFVPDKPSQILAVPLLV